MAAAAHQAYHTLNPVAEIPTRRYLWQKGGRHDGDRIAVYPKFEALDIRPRLRVRAQPLRNPRFVADAHLGGLARLLRMAGFDTLFDNRGHDKEIADIAARMAASCSRATANCSSGGMSRTAATSMR